MKKNLILGVILLGVMLMSVVGVFAQEITGDLSSQNLRPVKTGSGNQEAPTSGSDESSASSSTKDSISPTSARKGSSAQKRTSQSSACPGGWLPLLADDGKECCRKAENKGRTTGRFLGRLFE